MGVCGQTHHGSAQFTMKLVVAVPPEGTVTVCGFALVTVQFTGTPESATIWLLAARFVNVTLPFGGIAWLVVLSTVTVYAVARLSPVVLVVTVRLPGGVVQPTLNDAVAVPPDGTVTVCVLPPLTVQFPGTPESATVWLPAARFENVTLPFGAIGWLVVPSTVAV